jgi:hypothetical protein
VTQRPQHLVAVLRKLPVPCRDVLLSLAGTLVHQRQRVLLRDTRNTGNW